MDRSAAAFLAAALACLTAAWLAPAYGTSNLGTVSVEAGTAVHGGARSDIPLDRLGASHRGAVSVDMTNNSLAGTGTAVTITETSTTSTASARAEGVRLRLTSGTVTGDQAGWTLGDRTLRGDQAGYWCAQRFRLSLATSVRAYVSVSDTDDDVMSLTNTPAATDATNYVGLRFSTPAGDSNFMFAAGNGTTDTFTDSGVTADAAVHWLVIDSVSSTEIRVYLLSDAFVVEGEAVLTTTLPGATVPLGPASGLEIQSGSARSYDFYAATFGGG